MLSALVLGSAVAFAPSAGPGRTAFVIQTTGLNTVRMGPLDKFNKGSFYDDDAPSTEIEQFQGRTKKQQDKFAKLSPKLKDKLLEESAAADPNQANRGVIYAIGLVFAAIVFGGNGVLYKLGPADLGADQVREASQAPGKIALPTFGSSTGTAKPFNI